jgi:ABC-2 type transport system ATP-binding protein
MWQTIRALARGGTTVFLTTQYLEEADELAGTIALLHKGKIVASGTARELKKLVPSGLVKFTFRDEKQREAAIGVLEEDYDITKGNDLTLTAAAGGGTAQLAGLFIRLRDAELEPVDFSQQIPTLEDVFFKLTGDKKEEN